MNNNQPKSTISVRILTVLAVVLSVTFAAPGRADEGKLEVFILGSEITEEELREIFEADSNGKYEITVPGARVGLFLIGLELIGQGDPFLEYTLTATNTSAEPNTLFYGMTIDIVPLTPADPDWLMRSTLEYGVEDTDGDGSAMLVPDALSGLQQAVLSDDRTNFVSDPTLSLGFDELTAPGQVPASDTGSLPLLDVPPLPPGVTIDTYGVMGLQGLFELSPGDTAVISGRFEIVPEPATIVVCLCAGGLLFLRRLP